MPVMSSAAGGRCMRQKMQAITVIATKIVRYRLDVGRIDDAEADRRLRQTTAITGLLSIAFVGHEDREDSRGEPERGEAPVRRRQGEGVDGEAGIEGLSAGWRGWLSPTAGVPGAGGDPGLAARIRIAQFSDRLLPHERHPVLGPGSPDHRIP
jgi:hypothetical protein